MIAQIIAGSGCGSLPERVRVSDGIAMIPKPYAVITIRAGFRGDVNDATACPAVFSGIG